MEQASMRAADADVDDVDDEDGADGAVAAASVAEWHPATARHRGTATAMTGPANERMCRTVPVEPGWLMRDFTTVSDRPAPGRADGRSSRDGSAIIFDDGIE
jgi:hypothetical protein